MKNLAHNSYYYYHCPKLNNFTIYFSTARCSLSVRSILVYRNFVLIIVVIGLILYLFLASSFYIPLNYFHLNSASYREVPTATCHIPQLNPYDPSIEKYIGVPKEDLKCEQNYPRYFTTDKEGNLIQLRNPTEHGYLSCCYCKFQRKNRSDMEIVTSTTCKPIKSNKTKVPEDHEFILVKCLTNINDKGSYKIVDMFGFVPLKPVANNPNFTEPLHKNRVNVVVLGLDSVSHMNFLRTFKASYSYLVNNLSGIGMWGYNKNADNTFLNILPVLSGLSESELKNSGWNASQNFDAAPLIWKNFSQEGYRTAFSEDAVQFGMFHWRKSGFLNPPTDYYHHPLMRAMDEQLGHTSLNGACNLCQGSRLSLEVMLDLIKKMAVTMNKDKRYFHFTWTTALTHGNINYGNFGDNILLEKLQWFNEEDYLKDTILIIMSDHGARVGDMRATLQGKIEDRMPFLYFVFPQWFQQKYAPAIENLKGNKKLLTTHFDLHETLMDLLHLNNIHNHVLRERQFQLAHLRTLPRGISLFLRIPLTRTCEEAGISSHWCICRELKPLILEGNEIVVEGALQAVKMINHLLSKSPQCQKLVFDSVLNAQLYRLNESEMLQNLNDPRLTKQQIRYNIGFKVRPSGGTFEATVTHHANGSWEVSEEINRTNLYGLQSRCVDDYTLRTYCYCS